MKDAEDLCTPARVETPVTSSEDPRVGHLIGSEKQESPAAVIIGFPVDEGVRINGGRPGAAEAPDTIRKFFYRLCPGDSRLAALFKKVADAGNVKPGGTLAESQERLGRVTEMYLSAGTVPVVLGGGHETSYGHFLGYLSRQNPVHVINWDAHPDVRDLKDGQGHSGSPFRQMLLHPGGRCAGYTVCGLLPHSAAESHLEFISRQGGRFFFREQITPEFVDSVYKDSKEGSDVLVSFDMDALDQSVAPGVSAPAAGGLDLNTWLNAAFQAGRSRNVKSVDIVEFNPAFDRDAATARVAALSLWNFFRGLAER